MRFFSGSFLSRHTRQSKRKRDYSLDFYWVNLIIPFEQFTVIGALRSCGIPLSSHFHYKNPVSFRWQHFGKRWRNAVFRLRATIRALILLCYPDPESGTKSLMSLHSSRQNRSLQRKYAMKSLSSWLSGKDTVGARKRGSPRLTYHHTSSRH